MNFAKTAFLGSILVVGALCYLLYRETRPSGGEAGEPLVVYCAEALRLPMDAIAKEYQQETGRKVELRFRPTQWQLSKGDLFLPADDSDIAMARDKGLVAETLPLARMHGVLLLRPGLQKEISTWQDLFEPPRKLGLANPEAAAVSKLAQAH